MVILRTSIAHLYSRLFFIVQLQFDETLFFLALSFQIQGIVVAEIESPLPYMWPFFQASAAVKDSLRRAQERPALQAALNFAPLGGKYWHEKPIRPTWLAGVARPLLHSVRKLFNAGSRTLSSHSSESKLLDKSSGCKLEAGEVHLYLNHAQNVSWLCAECSAPGPLHDRQAVRCWRQLDSCQYQTIFHASPPRIQCTKHGVKVVKLPWAEAGARFTADSPIMRPKWSNSCALIDYAISPT
jgi:hypothetical protein